MIKEPKEGIIELIEPHASKILLQLSQIGEKPDAEIDLFETALLIASLDHPGRSIDRYRHHKDRVVESCHKAHTKPSQTAEERLNILQEILALQEGYVGDTDNYDLLDNADLMSVIDRRKGLPVALSILYISVAQELGWDVKALNFPAHVFLRIEAGGERIIFDPFEGAKIMEAHDLREKLKDLVGTHAELSSAYYNTMTHREILARLQNNIKTRLISGEDFDSALQRISIMRLILPDDPRLLFEAGVLNARIGQNKKAIQYLYDYIDSVEAQTNQQAYMQADAKAALHIIKDLEDSLI